MKKLFVFAILVGCCGAVFAQTGPTGSKPASQPAASPAMTAIQTAYDLAKYGYANYSASALIGAAEILVKTPTLPSTAKPESSGPAATGSKKTGTPEFTPANLLADARKFAAGDATMIAWADAVQKSVGAATRGAVGGPQYGVHRVGAGGSISFSLPLRPGEYVDIICSGDGDTDLDMYLYNPDGSLNAYDEGPTDFCRISGVTGRTASGAAGVCTLVIKNRGRTWNQFEIVTN